MESIYSLLSNDPKSHYLRRIGFENISFCGKQIKLKQNPIFKYNYFVTCYNYKGNKINSITLPLLPRNRVYYISYPMLQPKYAALHVFLSLLPYLNIVWCFFLIYLWLVYERARLVYDSNKRLVRNPLRKMIFDPEICLSYNCMNKFLEVPVKGSSTNPGSEEKITVMVYNQSFKKILEEFPLCRYIHIFHILICFVLVYLGHVYGLFRLISIRLN